MKLVNIMEQSVATIFAKESGVKAENVSIQLNTSRSVLSEHEVDEILFTLEHYRCGHFIIVINDTDSEIFFGNIPNAISREPIKTIRCPLNM